MRFSLEIMQFLQLNQVYNFVYETVLFKSNFTAFFNLKILCRARTVRFGHSKTNITQPK